jgi:uncharacterized protein
MVACADSHVNVGQLLISKFPRCIPWQDKAGMDALMLCARHGTLPLLVPLLTNSTHPANPHAHDLDGNTALHHASAAGELMAIRILLQYGASPTATNAYSWTPLAYSSTVAAEAYFKNLINEMEKLKHQAQAQTQGERKGEARMRGAGAVRLVTSDDGDNRSGAKGADDFDFQLNPLPTPPKIEWSPIEGRRAMTPTFEKEGWTGTEVRRRADSGD